MRVLLFCAGALVPCYVVIACFLELMPQEGWSLIFGLFGDGEQGAFYRVVPSARGSGNLETGVLIVLGLSLIALGMVRSPGKNDP